MCVWVHACLFECMHVCLEGDRISFSEDKVSYKHPWISGCLPELKLKWRSYESFQLRWSHRATGAGPACLSLPTHEQRRSRLCRPCHPEIRGGLRPSVSAWQAKAQHAGSNWISVGSQRRRPQLLSPDKEAPAPHLSAGCPSWTWVPSCPVATNFPCLTQKMKCALPIKGEWKQLSALLIHICDKEGKAGETMRCLLFCRWHHLLQNVGFSQFHHMPGIPQRFRNKNNNHDHNTQAYSNIARSVEHRTANNLHPVSGLTSSQATCVTSVMPVLSLNQPILDAAEFQRQF